MNHKQIHRIYSLWLTNPITKDRNRIMNDWYLGDARPIFTKPSTNNLTFAYETTYENNLLMLFNENKY